MNIKVKPLYHLTRKENLENITRFGLIPGFSRGITCNRKQESVFLTDDIKVPIEQLGSTYSPESWVVLQVDVEGLNVEPYRTTGLQINLTVPNEFIVRSSIHPKRIRRIMKIKKLKDGRTSIQILQNQTITYDPTGDSYMIQTEVGDRIHTSTITSDILDALYNRAWEGEE